MEQNEKRKYKLQKCNRTWASLNKIEGEADVRYCNLCCKTVHYCDTEEQVANAAEKKWCIAAENRLVFSTPPEANLNTSAGHFLGNVGTSYRVEASDGEPNGKGFLSIDEM